MLRLLSFALVSAPAFAWAAFFPSVTKGPVISGVTQTEAWVAWATAHHEGTGAQCSAEAFTGSPNTDLPTATISPTGSDGSQFSDSTCSRLHRVHLTGLAPDTRYTFTLDKGYDGGQAAGGTFRTAPEGQDTRFTFVVYGDNRDAPITSSSTRPDHQAVSDGILDHENDADFLVHTGDLALNIVGISGDDNGYTEFFDVERGLLSSRPIFAVIGNHETIDTQEFDDLVNAPSFAGSPHPYYGSVDWGRAHLVFVDSFEGAAQLSGRASGVSAEQEAWLEQDMAAAQKAGQHIFVVTHQGAFSHGDSSAHGGSQAVRDHVLPIMLRHQALAIFAGHDHYYERGHEGCVDYFVVGGGGAPMYEPDPSAPGVAVAAKRTSYFVVTVDGANVTGIAKSSSGQILDTFTFQPADGTSCGVPPVVVDTGHPDGGTTTPDAGSPTPDAGSVVIEHRDAGASEADAGADDAPDAGEIVLPHRDPPKAASEGCNCAGAGGAAMALWGLAALALRRRASR